MGGMTTLPDPRKVNIEDFGMPTWAWPVMGLTAGLALVILVYGTCFVDPNCK